MDPLATIEDLEARLGRQFTGFDHTRAQAILTDASAAIRGFTGQKISRATSTVRLTPPAYTMWGYDRGVSLPQWPVVSVDTVTDEFGNSVGVTWVYGDFVAVTGPVVVTYTHGWDPVPDDIIASVCQIAGRAFGMQSDTSGVTSETLGGYSYAIGAAAAAGPLGMLNDERTILKKYRRPTRPISMTGLRTETLVSAVPVASGPGWGSGGWDTGGWDS